MGKNLPSAENVPCPSSPAVMGWTPPARGLLRKQRVEPVTLYERSRIMSKVTIAVDLAKDIF
ncbi:MAG TPA: hypothetical protein VGW38_25960, partial [Chloroflexota bacterium]|nr:hypothetical protein [Chloroflexota bacterium]